MTLKRFIIERNLPQVGALNREELGSAAAASNAALRELGPDIQWVHSYVTGDKTFCVYLAKDEAIIREHAARTGLPATTITEVSKVIDPTIATPPYAGA
jgi:hypothetical protein